MSGLPFTLPWFEIRDMEKRRVVVRLGDRRREGEEREVFQLASEIFQDRCFETKQSVIRPRAAFLVIYSSMGRMDRLLGVLIMTLWLQLTCEFGFLVRVTGQQTLYPMYMWDVVFSLIWKHYLKMLCLAPVFCPVFLCRGKQPIKRRESLGLEHPGGWKCHCELQLQNIHNCSTVVQTRLRQGPCHANLSTFKWERETQWKAKSNSEHFYTEKFPVHHCCIAWRYCCLLLCYRYTVCSRHLQPWHKPSDLFPRPQ